jgi:multicomponent Na+:H+ antiporter subunit B
MIKKVAAVIITLSFIGFLLIGLSDFGSFGIADPVVYNEVTARYLEKSIEETGAVNAVAGMILDYRAFDTFIEASVIYTALVLVLMLLLKNKDGEDAHDNTNH